MNEIDELMKRLNEDVVEFVSLPENIEKIIAYYRQKRAEYESGGKVSKTESIKKIDLSALGLVPKKDKFSDRRF